MVRHAPGASSSDHAYADGLVVDLTPLTAEEREGLGLMLDAEQVAHDLRGNLLRVPPAEAELVAELVDIARSAPARLAGDEIDPLVGDPRTGAPDLSAPTADRFGPRASPRRWAVAVGAAAAAMVAASVIVTRRR